MKGVGMKEKTLIVTIDNPQVQVKVNGDLSIKGQDQREISAATRYSGNLTLRQEGVIFQVLCLDDCRLTVPSNTVINVERVGGDARIADISADVHLQKVGGDLALININLADVEKIGGDCVISHVQGNLEIQQVGGDFTGQDINGAINLGKVGGDILLQKSSGELQVRSGGDMRIGTISVNLPASTLRCSGDLHFFVMPESNGVLNISSSSEDIVLNLANHYDSIEEHSYTLTLGKGGQQVDLSAGGDVIISDQSWEEDILDDFPADFGMESLRNLDEEINAHVERATRRAHEAARRAEQRVTAAMNRMEQSHWSIDDHLRHRVMGGKGFNMGNVTRPYESPRDPVTDAERLMVLKMVQDKKITVEEAEKLLQAMEGRKS
jgi:hypothetical protein